MYYFVVYIFGNFVLFLKINYTNSVVCLLLLLTSRYVFSIRHQFL